MHGLGHHSLSFEVRRVTSIQECTPTTYRVGTRPTSGLEHHFALGRFWPKLIFFFERLRALSFLVFVPACIISYRMPSLYILVLYEDLCKVGTSGEWRFHQHCRLYVQCRFFFVFSFLDSMIFMYGILLTRQSFPRGSRQKVKRAGGCTDIPL